MKRIIKRAKLFLCASTMLLLGLSTSAFAMVDSTAYGPYAGLDLGVSHVNVHDQSGLFDISKDGGAGRIFAGFMFNENFGGEIGYALLRRLSFTGPNDVSGKVRYQAIDIVLTGVIPFDYGFGLFANVGGAWVKSKVRNLEGAPNVSFAGDESKFTFTYGLGALYDTSDVRLSLGWKRYQKSGSFPSIDFAYLGLAFFFGCV